jgi:hypothetical protein
MSPPIRDGSGNSIGSIRLGDGSEISEVRTGAGDVLFSSGPLVKSEFYRYLTADFTTSSWSDSINGNDIDNISGSVFDSSLFDNTGGITTGTADFYAEDIDDIWTRIDQSWAFAMGFSTTDSNGYLGGGDVNSFDEFLQFAVGADVSPGILTASRGTNNDQRVLGPSVDDGGDYVVIIQSTGPQASDLEIYFTPSSNVASVDINSGALNPPANSSLGEFAYTTRADVLPSPNQIRSLNMDNSDIRWFTDSLTQSERSDVFDAYSWYDPSTDAP